MSKSGGKPNDVILSLEDALKRFKHQDHRSEESGAEDTQRSNVVDFAPVRREGSPGNNTTMLNEDPREFAASAEAESEEIVAMLNGVPRTFQDLERMAVLEELRVAEAIAEDEASAKADWYGWKPRSIRRGELTFTAMGAAMVVWVAFLVTYVPHRNRAPIAGASPALALKASAAHSPGDLITTLVILADNQSLPVASLFKPTDMEARVKNELRAQAFPDIGVSVGKFRDVYLAGLVYSKEEARSIQAIVHKIIGVRRVHFLHPDIREARGPAYFGATTWWSPDVWGAKVQAVFIGSPADKAGIQPGDVISEFDGKTIPDAKSFNSLLQSYLPGQRVRFRVWHNGEPQYLVARLGETVASVAGRQTAMR